MYAWILAMRTRTLGAAVVPVAVGTVLAWADTGTYQPLVLALALSAALAIQITTNLFNDVLDFEKGADTEARLGPPRAAQQGLISARALYQAALLSAAIALLCGLPLVWLGGWPILALGLVSLALSYAYTGGPWPLAYKGLGDLFVLLFFGLAAVTGVYYLHTGVIAPAALVAGTQVGLFASVLIAINNLRDIDEDRQAGKATLAVRFGAGFARWEISLLGIAGLALGAWWLQQDRLPAALLPLLLLPWLLRQGREVFRHAPGTIYNRFLARAALKHLLFGALLSLGLLAA